MVAGVYLHHSIAHYSLASLLRRAYKISTCWLRSRVGKSGWKSWWYGHSLLSDFFPGSTWSMYHDPSIPGMAGKNRIRHPKLAHCRCLMCQRNHKSEDLKKSVTESSFFYGDRTQCCIAQQRWVLVLAPAVCTETVEGIFPIWTFVLMLFSVHWDREWACIVTILVSLEAIGCSSGHCVHAVEAWGVCDLLLFRNDEVFVTCVSWVVSFVFSMGKQANDKENLYALRTNDTSILLDSIYMKKGNVLLVNVDIFH